MTISGVKAMVGKMIAIGLVAGAVALVAPAKAEAQHFAIGVQFGPSYHDEGRRDYYERERYERERAAIAQHEAWERHERWEQHERRERWERAREYGRDRGYSGYGDQNGYGYNGQNGYGYNTPNGYYGR